MGMMPVPTRMVEVPRATEASWDDTSLPIPVDDSVSQKIS